VSGSNFLINCDFDQRGQNFDQKGQNFDQEQNPKRKRTDANKIEKD